MIRWLDTWFWKRPGLLGNSKKVSDLSIPNEKRKLHPAMKVLNYEFTKLTYLVVLLAHSTKAVLQTCRKRNFKGMLNCEGRTKIENTIWIWWFPIPIKSACFGPSIVLKLIFHSFCFMKNKFFWLQTIISKFIGL